jgi:hypothetical protein
LKLKPAPLAIKQLAHSLEPIFSVIDWLDRKLTSLPHLLLFSFFLLNVHLSLCLYIPLMLMLTSFYGQYRKFELKTVEDPDVTLRNANLIMRISAKFKNLRSSIN